MSAGGFKRPEGLSVLEATRMALSDCGVDPEMVWMQDGDPIIYTDPRLDIEFGWRAAQLARPDLVECLSCLRSRQNWVLPDHAGCLAEYPFTEDCGASR